MTTMERVFGRPHSLTGIEAGLCPGCGHGISWRLIAEVIDAIGMREKAITTVGVGCFDFMASAGSLNFDEVHALHGRAPAVATGLKRVLPDRLVFSVQGDGDMGAEGTAEILHAAIRGERFTALLLNNANFGETGGHMSPTTLIGQRTKTTPQGRDLQLHGYPLRMAELIASIDGAAYVARVALTTPAEVMRARRTIRRAFELQMSGVGLSFIEVLSPCPSGWGINPEEAIQWMQERMIPAYPLREFKTPDKT